MKTILIAILSSTVISGLISGKISLHMNRKELEVKLKLEEKNKWIENINKAHKDYIDSTTEYMNALIAYSLDQVDREHISNRLNTTNKTQNTLIFFMYQSEYNLSSVKEAENLMQKNTDTLNKQQQTVNKYLDNEIKRDVLEKVMGEVEVELGDTHDEFSKKLGIMIRVEKEGMTNKIIK